MLYTFDNNSLKSDILDDSSLNQVVNNIVRSSNDRESDNPQKDSMVSHLMGQIEFFRNEIKFKNIIIERSLTLKSLMYDKQLFS